MTWHGGWQPSAAACSGRPERPRMAPRSREPAPSPRRLRLRPDRDPRLRGVLCLEPRGRDLAGPRPAERDRPRRRLRRLGRRGSAR